MKLKEAIQQHEQAKKIVSKNKLVGIKLGDIFITNEMLDSDRWAYSYEITDPEMLKNIDKARTEIARRTQ